MLKKQYENNSTNDFMYFRLIIYLKVRRNGSEILNLKNNKKVGLTRLMNRNSAII